MFGLLRCFVIPHPSDIFSWHGAWHGRCRTRFPVRTGSWFFPAPAMPPHVPAAFFAADPAGCFR